MCNSIIGVNVPGQDTRIENDFNVNKLAGLDWPAFFDELGEIVDYYAYHSGEESIVDCSEKEGLYTDQYGNQQLQHTYCIEQENGETTLIRVSVSKRQKWNRRI